MSIAALAIGCRPRPEDPDIAAFSVTTPDGSGLSNISAGAGVVEAGGEVSLTNATTETSEVTYASTDGAVSFTLPASIGDVIYIAYYDPDATLLGETHTVPLQSIEIHGQIDTAVTDCVAFERDDLVDSELNTQSQRYELLGGVTDELLAFTTNLDDTVRVYGTPIIFGVGSCGLPLFEPTRFFPDTERPIDAWHGQVATAQNEDGAPCKVLNVTTKLPAPADDRGAETEVIATVLPAGEAGRALVAEASVGDWVVVTGALLDASETLPCDAKPLAVETYLFDTGERLLLDTQLTVVDDPGREGGVCIQCKPAPRPANKTEEDWVWSLRGPMVAAIPPTEHPVRIAGYPTIGLEDDRCGPALTLAGWPPPEGHAPPGERELVP